MHTACLVAELNCSHVRPEIHRVFVSRGRSLRIGYFLDAVLLEKEGDTPEAAEKAVREELMNLARQFLAWGNVARLLERDDLGIRVRQATAKDLGSPYDLSNPNRPKLTL